MVRRSTPVSSGPRRYFQIAGLDTRSRRRDGEESFDVIVASPRWLAVRAGNPAASATRASTRSSIPAPSISAGRLSGFQRRIPGVEADTWPDVATIVARLGRREIDGRSGHWPRDQGQLPTVTNAAATARAQHVRLDLVRRAVLGAVYVPYGLLELGFSVSGWASRWPRPGSAAWSVAGRRSGGAAGPGVAVPAAWPLDAVGIAVIAATPAGGLVVAGAGQFLNGLGRWCWPPHRSGARDLSAD
jgi:hypothetical protein